MWQKDKTNLTLTFIWNEFETYCKPHSKELQAWYELFKQLSQGTTPCDDWYTTVQNQLTMCNYKAETESVLQCDIFLFSLNDQTFISKIISEESPDVTAATIRQKLKKFEAGRTTAKYIKSTNTIGKDPTVEGVNQVQKQGNPKGKRGKAGIRTQISIRKAIQQKSHLSQTPNKGSHTDKDKNSTNQNLKRPLIICKCCGDTRHRPGFNCPLSRFQCKKFQKYGHFTSKCLTKPQSTNVNTIEEVNAVLAFTKSLHSVQAELSDDDSLDAMYICTVNTSKPKRRVFADLQLATQSSTKVP